MGSANINDRSLRGDRDSEIACVYEDWEDLIESRMDGKPVRQQESHGSEFCRSLTTSTDQVKVSRFAATLRRQIYKESLGIAMPHLCPPGRNEPVTAEMRPVAIPHDDVTSSDDDVKVMVRWQSTASESQSLRFRAQDPLSPETEALLRATAKKNSKSCSPVLAATSGAHAVLITAEIFEDVFHVLPTDRVSTWAEVSSPDVSCTSAVY